MRLISGKLLEANETVLLIPAYDDNTGNPQLIGDTLVPYTAPTSAVLNKWLSNVSLTALSNGGNISCAIKDDLKLEEVASDTDKDRTICSTGTAETPTLYHFDAQLNSFFDADLTSTGLFNLFKVLTFGPDAPYWIAQRIGYRSNVAAAVGQEWNFFYAWTDNAVVTPADDANTTIAETFIPKGLIHVRYTLAA